MVSDVGAALIEAETIAELDKPRRDARGTDRGARAGAPQHPAQRIDPSFKRDRREDAPPAGTALLDPGLGEENRGAEHAPTPPEGMCFVPAGIFMLGESKQPRYLPDYFIDVYPVTNQEYAEFVRDTGAQAPRFWRGGEPPPGKADHPVVGITMEDARAFATWMGKDLPSEEEWEKAARATDGRTYPWGDLFSPDRCNVSGAGIKDTSPIRDFKPGASPYGCLDMAGNVWEWTKSAFQAGGKNRALKGGSWYDFSNYARCASRFSAPPGYEGNSVGFRCVYRPEESDVAPRDRRLPPGGDYEIATAKDPSDSPRKRSGGEDHGRAADAGAAKEACSSGPLSDMVETAVGAFGDFNLAAAQARVEEVLGSLEIDRMVEEDVGRPEVLPELEVPLPAGRWTRWLRPLARGIRLLLPWSYRAGDRVDRFFRTAPRWLTIFVIMAIPLSTFSVVYFGTESGDASPRTDAGSRRAAGGKPRRPEKTNGAAAKIPRRPGGGAAAANASGPRAPGVATVPAGMIHVAAGPACVGRENRRVQLPDYFIDRHEVTNLEYRKFVEATDHPRPAHWVDGAIPAGLERHPVTNVDHADATAYAAWAGKRLPTEDEWEKAARGPEGRRYPWGNEPDPTRANLFRPSSQFMGTRPVESMPRGASPYGCQDMAGNVLEWTSTRCGENYVLKGGSWGLSRESGACSFRYVFFPPETRTPMVGFRCVKDAPE